MKTISKSFLTISLMIIAGYLLSCLPISNFTLKSITPSSSHYSASGTGKVPCNAVIKMVFESDAEIDEDYLTLENFKLWKEVVKENTEPTKTDTANQSANKQQTDNTQQTKTEDVEVKGILKVETPQPGTVPLTSENADTSLTDVKAKFTTTVYFIPAATKKASEKDSSPLTESSTYKFIINKLKDKNENIYEGSTTRFTTKESRFKFSLDAQLSNVVDPKGLTVKKGQYFILEFDSPVNPKSFQAGTKLYSTGSLSDAWANAHPEDTIDSSDTSTSENKEELTTFNQAGQRTDPRSNGTSITHINANREHNLVQNIVANSDLEKEMKDVQDALKNHPDDEIFKDYLQYLTEQKENGAATNSATTSTQDPRDAPQADETDKKTTETAPPTTVEKTTISKYDTKPRESLDYTLVYLEDFKGQEKNEFILAKYTRIAVVTNVDPFYRYELAIQLSKNSKAIKSFKPIQVENKDFDKSTLSKWMEINFFQASEEE